ncbi:WD40-repeat-containing domain protein [Morchella snyderi]|nr:WD40-repeat-containing domain protein [Morchella snyderi]
MASMTPPIFNVEDLVNAAAGVAPQHQPQTGETATMQQPLRTSQSFRVDEGYSGEETPSVYEDPNQREDLRSIRESAELKIPAWVTGLDDASREEYAYKLVRTLPTSNIASLVDRLVPILHLDFVQLLPSELSLQILSLWRDLYKGAGWEENSAEVRLFENEMQQQKRKAEEQRDEEKKLRDLARRNIDRFRSGPGSQGERSASDLSAGPMDMSGDSSTQGSSGPSLPIQPTLTMPGYNHPRLNWAFLYKNRKKLEENWLHNRFTTFQIPHPNYPHEGHTECIYTIQYSPNFLVSGSRDRTIRIWNMRTRRLVGEPLKGHTGSVLCLQFDEEEQVLVTGSSDSSVVVWKFPTGEKLKVIEKAHQESVLNLKFSKKWLVTCSKDKLVKVWNREQLETTNKDYPWPSMGSGLNLQNPYSTGSNPHRAFGASTRAPPKGGPRTLQPYTVVQVLAGHAAAVNAIQLHGDQIASASGDRLIKLWNLRTGACEKAFIGHTKGIACIQFDGRTIVSGSSDQTIRVFDCDTQAEVATLQGHGALVRTVQATRNRIVSGSYDETVRIWHGDQEDRWVIGAILHQSQSPAALRSAAAAGAGTPANVPAQIATLYQQQGIQPAAVHMHQIQQVGNQAGLAGAVAASQLLPTHHHHNMAPRPIQPPQAVLPQIHGNSGTHRVFKLQFDARWIICCSQDSKIIGWDYAADEESIMEASRFFKGG